MSVFKAGKANVLVAIGDREESDAVMGIVKSADCECECAPSVNGFREMLESGNRCDIAIIATRLPMDAEDDAVHETQFSLKLIKAVSRMPADRRPRIVAFAVGEGGTISMERSNMLSDCGSDVIYGERELLNNREGLARIIVAQTRILEETRSESRGAGEGLALQGNPGDSSTDVSMMSGGVPVATVNVNKGERKLLTLLKMLKANQDGTAFTIPHKTVAHGMGWDFEKYCNRRSDNTPNYKLGPIKHYLNDERLAQLGIFLDFDASGLQVAYSPSSVGNTAS